MQGVRTTCYIRIPFTVDGSELNDYTKLTLKVRYDDGFLAFINGTKLTAEANPPVSTPNWQSASNGQHSDNAAVSLLSFDISSQINLLQPGNNILAIHGLNVGLSSSDFLISVKLIAEENTLPSGGISPSAIAYSKSFTLNSSNHVKARVLDGSTWSALNEATFAVGPVVDSLRITEIMYHPADEPVGDPNAEALRDPGIDGVGAHIRNNTEQLILHLVEAGGNMGSG